MLILFDAHSHLSNISAPDLGVLRVICGTCEADWDAVLAHAASGNQTIPMLGLHPWFVAEASRDWAPRLESLLRFSLAGVGECGLDFSRKAADRAAQELAFRIQLRLAQTLHRPVAIHAVRAWGRLLELLREEGIPAAGAMVHAFSGSPEIARALQAMGVFLSFSGDLLKPERLILREALAAVSPEYLLIESDGTADLPGLLAVAADLRGVSAAHLAVQTWENGRRCFKELLA
jgi:TatD DNase family protein